MYRNLSQSLFYEIKCIHIIEKMTSFCQNKVKKLKKKELDILVLEHV